MKLNRRKFFKGAGAAGLGLAAGSLLTGAAPLSQRPNLLYVFSDQQFAEAMSCAGSPWVKTPNIDSLAATGVRFNQAYTTHPLCSPARSSMLTGFMPHQTGVTGNELTIHPELQPQEMGWVFQKAGYRSTYVGKGHLPNYTRLEPSHGFEVLPALGDAAITAAGVNFLSAKHDRPFLFVVSFNQPHAICELVHMAEPAEGKMFANKSKLSLAELTKKSPPLPDNFDPPTPVPGAAGRVSTKGWSPEQWRRYLYAYYQYVEEVDTNVGKLLQALRTSGQDQNTLVIFSSDHGDGLAAHHTSGKNLFYEEMSRVPFIMSFPGRTQPSKVDHEHLVSTGLDLMPTLCDYAGIAVPAGLTGHSIRPLAEGGQTNQWRDQVVAECGGGGVQGVTVPGRMVRTKQFKYTAYSSTYRPPEKKAKAARKTRGTANTPARGVEPLPAKNLGHNPLEELFDLQKDPGEKNNLAAQAEFKDVLSEHQQRLSLWCEKTRDSMWVG